MALLRVSDGRVFTAIEDINAIVKPMEIGRFPFDDALRARVDALPQPLSPENAKLIVGSLDSSVRERLDSEGYVSWRVGNVLSKGEEGFAFHQHFEGGETGGGQKSPEQIKDYLTPHHVLVNDIHFVFTGAIIKGVQLENGLQAVCYVEAGEWIRLGPTILNWPIFPSGKAITGLSFFDQKAGPDQTWKMDLHPEVKVDPTMLF
ncbi:hypothetical protein [Phyllobacterium sp. YR531]|uniref:hypothetical protein n=1 Tax=Phyllobacterium sp. YR531 TaxID=1144343 RepID=UPI00026FBA86|nr:hypothetical protein [Phyllobacterium sp. YR531]EJN05856.1 hypothetical protein PMI41_00647 [Phyllobacterium sp. YR531]